MLRLPDAAVSVIVYTWAGMPTTGPALAAWTPVALPDVVAVLPPVIPPPVMLRLNWSLEAARPTTFFCNVSEPLYWQLAMSAQLLLPRLGRVATVPVLALIETKLPLSLPA